jgi:hypothetical protein
MTKIIFNFFLKNCWLRQKSYLRLSNRGQFERRIMNERGQFSDVLNVKLLSEDFMNDSYFSLLNICQSPEGKHIETFSSSVNKEVH